MGNLNNSLYQIVIDLLINRFIIEPYSQFLKLLKHLGTDAFQDY